MAASSKKLTSAMKTCAEPRGPTATAHVQSKKRELRPARFESPGEVQSDKGELLMSSLWARIFGMSASASASSAGQGSGFRTAASISNTINNTLGVVALEVL